MDRGAYFPTDVAAKLGKVTPKTLERWQATGFLSPTVPAPQRGRSALYTFADVVAIRIAAQLRAEGASLQGLRRVVAYLSKRKGLSPTQALATTHLVTDGHDVYELAGDVSISTLRRPGQRTMLLLIVPLHDVVAELQVRAVRAA
jgi:MerR family transcriptional regulator/heat shock protein HspR